MGGEERALAATEEACRVYVGNLLPKAKERHLTSKFARFGTIHSVWIARKPPGFAFVRFAGPDAAQRAVETCKEEGAMEILGKAVRVQMAGDKDRKQSAETEEDPKPAESRGAIKKGDTDLEETDDGGAGRRSCSSRRRGRSEDSRERGCERRRNRSRDSGPGERRRLGERNRRRDRRSRSSSRGGYRRDRSRSRSETRNSSRPRRRHVERGRSRSWSWSSRNSDGARRRSRRRSRSSGRSQR